MALGIAFLALMVLWLVGWRMAAGHPEQWSRTQPSEARPSPQSRVKTTNELPVPQLVDTGGGQLLTGARHSAGWQAPDGTSLSLN
ncbi:hypothetical protein DYH09_24925 [bacterium CPR1]|nr:hypothetical protein [bacterium CPR1]